MDNNSSPIKIASSQNKQAKDLYNTISEKNTFRRESSRPKLTFDGQSRQSS
jgi:hypothetical protein